MNTKHTPHTPGPWTWGAKYVCKPVTKQVVYTNEYDDEVKTESHSYDLLAQCMPEDYASDKWEANARLMAAAPELLEALQAVIAVADRATDEFDRARAAIAKATGASHVSQQ